MTTRVQKELLEKRSRRCEAKAVNEYLAKVTALITDVMHAAILHDLEDIGLEGGNDIKLEIKRMGNQYSLRFCAFGEFHARPYNADVSLEMYRERLARVYSKMVVDAPKVDGVTVMNVVTGNIFRDGDIPILVDLQTDDIPNMITFLNGAIAGKTELISHAELPKLEVSSSAGKLL